MIQTKVVKTPNFGAFRLDLTRELNDAAKIVKLDIQTKMKDGKDYRGETLAPLADSTVQRKRKSKNAKTRANAEKPMLATENLLRNQNIVKATKQKQSVEIYIGPTREEIYGYHADGPDHNSNLPVRETFGLADNLGDKIDQMVINNIERMLRNL